MKIKLLIRIEFELMVRKMKEEGWSASRRADGFSRFGRSHAADYECAESPEEKKEIYNIVSVSLLESRHLREQKL